MKLIVVMLVGLSALAGLNKDAFSGERFFYIDQADRIEILKDLYRQTKAEYALWEIKKKRIGVDGDVIFSDAIKAEENFPNAEDAFSQAKGNLDFLDRVKVLISKFQDTHFSIRPKIGTSWVVSGFTTSLVGEKILITGKYDKVVAKIIGESENGSTVAKISLGDEILKVDGKSAIEVSKSLEKYIDASSEGFRKQEAAKKIIERYFAYPTKPYVDVEIKKVTGKILKVRLPYFHTVKDIRKDLKYYFKEVGMKSLNDLRFRFDTNTRQWVADRSLGYKGYDRTSLPKGAVSLKNYTQAKGGGPSIIHLALVLKDAKVTGYMQINSFSVSTLYKGDEKVDFPKAIKESVKYLKDNGLDLILDIRHNGGGRGGYPAVVLKALAKGGEAYKETTWAKRVTRYMRQFLDFYRTDEFYLQVGDEAFWAFLTDEFYSAVDERRTHTPALSKPDIKAEEGEGYNGKIVALISPSCISACDIMSMLLKSSKRATLIGTTANGTGAGYYSNTNLSTNFEDLYKVFSTNIPNTLFGYPGNKLGMNTFGLDSAYTLNSENVPVVADIQYVQSKKDYLQGHVDIIKKALKALSTQ